MTEYKVGQKVRYIGTGFPNYTDKIYRISAFWKGGVALSVNERVELEGSQGSWGLGFIASFDEIEEREAE